MKTYQSINDMISTISKFSNDLNFIYSIWIRLGCWGNRHTFALLCFTGLSVNYCMRVNLSVAIVEMVNSGSFITLKFQLLKFLVID